MWLRIGAAARSQSRQDKGLPGSRAALKHHIPQCADAAFGKRLPRHPCGEQVEEGPKRLADKHFHSRGVLSFHWGAGTPGPPGYFSPVAPHERPSSSYWKSRRSKPWRLSFV